ncbi:MAG: hypothetical protein IJO36_02370 [Clostridia bacterium]|nr:hypothetical protein [Clostridia bacterium]
MVSSGIAGILFPYRVIDLAKTFLPDILAFYESEEGKREFEDWKHNKKIS